jgi:hypothetical protein
MTQYRPGIVARIVQAIIVILVLLWLLPHLLNVYGLRPDDCVDWANSNPVISYVETTPCGTPLPFKPVP